MPAMPAAGSEWPSHDLAANRVMLLVALWGLAPRKTAEAAPISIGSPSGVPEDQGFSNYSVLSGVWFGFGVRNINSLFCIVD